MLEHAGLQPVALLFADAGVDHKARRAYREVGGDPDPARADLDKWHALEECDPDLFGRKRIACTRAGAQCSTNCY